MGTLSIGALKLLVGVVLQEERKRVPEEWLLVPRAAKGIYPPSPDFVVRVRGGSLFGGMHVEDQGNLAVA